MKSYKWLRVFALTFLAFALTACNVGGSSSSNSNVSSLRLIGYGTKVATDSQSVQSNEVTRDVAPSFPENDTGANICPNAGVIWVPPDNNGDAIMQSCTGTFFPVNVDTGLIGQLPTVYFANGDCTGQPMLTEGASLLGLYHRQGMTFTLNDGSTLHVMPGQATVQATATSSFTKGGCAPTALTFDGFIIPDRNDQSVSGVSGPSVGQLSFNSP